MKQLVSTEEAARILSCDEWKPPKEQWESEGIERRTFFRRLKSGNFYETKYIPSEKGGGKNGQQLLVRPKRDNKTEEIYPDRSSYAKASADRYRVYPGDPSRNVITPMKNGMPISHEAESMEYRERPKPAEGGDPVGDDAARQLPVGIISESPPPSKLPAIYNDTKRVPDRCNLPTLKRGVGKADRIANLRYALIQQFNRELTREDPNLPLFNGNGHRFKTQIIKKFLDLYNSGILLPGIYNELKEVSRATLYNWIMAVNQDGIDGLIPQYGGVGKSKITEHEKNLLLTLCLHQNRLKIAYAIQLAKEYLKSKNMESPSSPATLRRFIDQFKTEHYDIWVLRREGEKALNDKVMPYAERDPNFLEVGDGLVADGHRLNFQVIHPDTGKPCRVALVLFWDWRSSYPLGWEIMVEENIQCVASALRNAIITLGKVPKWVYLDNGKAFKAKIFTEDLSFDDTELPGMFARLNINYHFAQPYNAQAKPIERIFGILNEQLERLVPSYTGASIEDKPAWTKRNEKLARAAHNDYVPTIPETNDLIRAWRDRYAERSSRGRDGLRPIDIYNEGKGPGVDPAELTFLMMDREIKNVHRNGVTWLGWHWYAEALYGLKDKVVIRYSLSDLLDTKAASQIDWSRTKTHEIAETIQKIEETKRPKVINISPFLEEAETSNPGAQSQNSTVNPKTGCTAPMLNDEWEIYEWYRKQDIQALNNRDRDWIREYESSGEWREFYSRKKAILK